MNQEAVRKLRGKPTKKALINPVCFNYAEQKC